MYADYSKNSSFTTDFTDPPKCVHVKSKVIWIPLGSTKTILCQVCCKKNEYESQTLNYLLNLGNCQSCSKQIQVETDDER